MRTLCGFGVDSVALPLTPVRMLGEQESAVSFPSRVFFFDKKSTVTEGFDTF